MFTMKKIIWLLFIVALTGCKTNKGTSVDYFPILESMLNCSSETKDITFTPTNLYVFKESTVGADRKCLDLKTGKTFYSAFSSDKPFKTVTVRAFYSLNGPTARVFYPAVATVDLKSEKLKPAIVDEIIDESNSKNGYYLKITYIFNKPVKNIVVYSDRSEFDSDYNYQETQYSTAMVGYGAFSFRMVNNYPIKQNAGGPISIFLEDYYRN
jgi:hypothetical protein